MEPTDGEGPDYKLAERKPLKFIDQVLKSEVVHKKVAKTKARALDTPILSKSNVKKEDILAKY